MPDLAFEIVSATAARDLITPALSFLLRITNRPPEQAIHSILLRCQIQIEVARRRYTSHEQDLLHDLFDDPSRWGDTLKPMTWANLSVNIPAFAGSTDYSLTLPCSLDFNVSSAKYFHGIEGGEVPLTFLFSGSIFFDAGQGLLQVAPISWNSEVKFRLPVQTWKSLMDLHLHNAICLNLRRDVFDDLCRLKSSLGFPSFDETIEHLVAVAEQHRPVS